MSKQVKQMQMESLEQAFGGVKDLVLLSVRGLTCQADNQFRQSLRKKNIRLQWVKNTLARRVFAGHGIDAGKVWEGPTLLAWGTDSLKELSKGIDDLLKEMAKKDAKVREKITIKSAMAEGQPVGFDQALRMPTRLEAIGEVIGAALGPVSTIAAMLTGPASQIASQLQTIAEKKPEETPAPAEAAPAAG